MLPLGTMMPDFQLSNVIDGHRVVGHKLSHRSGVLARLTSDTLTLLYNDLTAVETLFAESGDEIA